MTSNSAAKNCNTGKVSNMYFAVNRFEELLRQPNRMGEMCQHIYQFNNTKRNDRGEDIIRKKYSNKTGNVRIT